MQIERHFIEQKTVHDRLDYDRQTGNLIWKKTTNPRVRPGSVAGWIGSGGYRQVEIEEKTFYAHRLVFLWHRGYLPEHDVDHIDRNKLNNKISNLREASRSCNCLNKENQSNNTSGVKGVTRKKSNGKWTVRISVGKKRTQVGTFAEFDEAVCHRLAAEQCTGADDMHPNSPASRYVARILK